MEARDQRASLIQATCTQPNEFGEEKSVKSPQTLKRPDADRYSDLKVMRSQAGFYVGTSYEDGSPGSRDSGYHPSREAAERTLSLIISGKIPPRMQP